MNHLKDFCAKALKSKKVDLEPVKNGGNNRGYRVTTEDRSCYLKEYYASDKNDRSRIRRESNFLSYCDKIGENHVPELIAWDLTQNLLLQTYILGEKVDSDSIGEDEIDQCLKFIQRINTNGFISDSKITFDVASDACFSILEHLSHVQRRYDRLNQVAVRTQTKLERDFGGFILNRVNPVLANLSAKLLDASMTKSWDCLQDQRVISPSDFGFHNALKDSDGNVMFLDFEYAGLDDPLKLICDFICQPQVPVRTDYLHKFYPLLEIRGIESSEEVIQLCLPLYRLKWIAIILG